LELAATGTFDASQPALERCLQRDPNDLEVLRAYAKAAMKAGKLIEAREILERWSKLDDSNPESITDRIDIWLALHQLPEATADAGIVLRLQPDNDEMRTRRAEWLLAAGELQDADSECRICLQHHPDDLKLMELQAKICQALGDNNRAREFIDRVLAKEPNRPAALVLRGALLIDSGQPDKAIPVLKRALGTRPEVQESVWYYLSLAYSQTGQHEEAQRAFAELQECQAKSLFQEAGRVKNNVGVQVRVAESLLNTGHAADGVRLLEQIVQQSPDCVSAHKLLADYYQKNGETEKAAFHRHRAQP
jgi:predicted Zn-dependent protease